MSGFSSIVARTFAVLLLVSPLVVLAGEPQPETPYEVPDGYNPDLAQVNFVEDRDFITVMEFAGDYNMRLESGESNRVARAAVAKEFYEEHPDNYDFLVIFTSFEFDTSLSDGGSALAFHSGTRNSVQGIGKNIFDNTEAYGSDGKLRATIDMAATSRYELNPVDPDFDLVLDVLGHEVLHNWCCAIDFENESGESDSSLLGRHGAHWSFFLDSDASLEYGSDWQPNGDGTYSAVATRYFYSPLDLYLMGFYGTDQVPDVTLLESDTEQYLAIDLPYKGAKISATERTVSIDQIVAENGPRLPSVGDSQKEFRFGFIYLVTPGESVSREDLNGIGEVRKQFSERFSIMTAGKAIAHIYPESIPATEAGELNYLSTLDEISIDSIGLEDALDWLEGQMDQDGFWGDSSATEVRDTTTALETLLDLQQGYGGNFNVTEWLESRADNNTDSLSRLALKRPNSVFLATLRSNQNDDGGWGLLPGYDSNPLDTALALEALALLDGFSNSRVISGVSYLVSQQNADGGWPSVPSSTSTLRATTQALGALYEAKNQGVTTDLAVNWLVGKAMPNGGFGDTVSNVVDTAQVVLTLSKYQISDGVDYTAALSYVDARQRIGGHWDGSVYATALAVQASQSVSMANPALSSLNVDNFNPTDGERVLLTALVVNDSSTGAINVPVGFYVGNDATGTPIGDLVIVPELPGFGSVVVSRYWDTFDQSGEQIVSVLVDPDDVFIERSENDNRQTVNVTVVPAPDIVELSISAADLLATPSTTNRIPIDISVSGSVRNIGQQEASDVRVQLLDDDVLVAEQTLFVPARSSTVANFITTLTTAGTHNYKLLVDSDNLYIEDDEANNSAIVSVTTEQGIDLAITQELISSPADVFLYQDATFDVRLTNFGTVDSPSVEVIFSIVTSTGTVELSRQDVSIPAGSSINREIFWLADVTGEAQLQVEIDGKNLVAEIDESNNNVQKPIRVLTEVGANISVNYQSMNFNPNPALEGMDVILTADLSNNGTEDLTDIELAMFRGNPLAGGEQVSATLILSTLAAGESQEVTLVWPSVDVTGDLLIYFAADPLDGIAETNESDNVAFADLTVIGLPDLAVSTASISVTPNAPTPLSSVEFDLLISNQGQQPAEDVLVRVYIDNQEIGDGYNIDLIDGNSSASLEIPYTVGPRGEYSLKVEIDPDNTLLESLISNNVAERSIAVQDSRFYLTERYISPDGNGRQDASSFYFSLDETTDVTVYITDSQGEVVRTFEQYSEVTSGSAEWDGKGDEGAVVADGDYHFVVADTAGFEIGNAKVTLDTNRLPVFESIGTEFGYSRNLSCSIGEIFESQNAYKSTHTSGPIFDSNDEYMYFLTFDEDGTNENILFSSGLYRSSINGSNVEELLLDGVDGYDGLGTNIDDISGVVLSPDGKTLAWHLERGYEDHIIQTINSDGTNLQTIYSSIKNIDEVVFSGNNQLISHSGDAYDTQLHLHKLHSFDETTLISEIDLTDYFRSLDDGGGNADVPDIQVSSDNRHLLVGYGRYGELMTDRTIYPPDSLGDLEEVTDAEFSGLFWIDIETQSSVYIDDKSAGYGWSNDGARFAYANASTNELVIRDNQNKTLQTIDLTSAGSNNSFISMSNVIWSPDGTEIVLVVQDYINGYLVDCERFDDCSEAEITTIEGRYPDVGGIYLFNLLTETVTKIADTILPVLEPRNEDDAIEPEEYLNRFEKNDLGVEVNDEGLPVILWTKDNYWVRDQARRNKELHWFDGSRSVLVSGGYAGATLIDLDNPGENSSVFLSSAIEALSTDYNTVVRPSATEKLFNYSSSDDIDSCIESGDHKQYLSLLNLAVDVRATVEEDAGGVQISGTAADKYLRDWTLEYAYADDPENWILLAPPSDEAVVDGRLTTWVPPEKSVYYLRLTANDLASNSRSGVTQVNFTDSVSITNLFRQPAYISPNGDDIQDVMEMNFRVLQPVNLAMQVFNEQDNLIRVYEQSFDVVGQDEILEWDGRTQAGSLAADGIYKILLQNYEFYVEVDSTPPSIDTPLANNIITPIYRNNEDVQSDESICDIDPSRVDVCVVSLDERLRYRVSDLNLLEYLIEKSPHGSNDWSDAGLNLNEESLDNIGLAPYFYVSDTIGNLVEYDYRVRANDKAGNTSVYGYGESKRNEVGLISGYTSPSDIDLKMQQPVRLGYKINTGQKTIVASSKSSQSLALPLNKRSLSADTDLIVIEVFESFYENTSSVEVLVKEKEGEDDYALVLPKYFISDISTNSHLTPHLTGDYSAIDGQFLVTFDLTENDLTPSTDYLVKVRISDELGRVTETDEIEYFGTNISHYLSSGIIVDEEQGNEVKFANGGINIKPNELGKLSLWISSEEDLRYYAPKVIDSFFVSPTNVIDDEQGGSAFSFNVTDLIACKKYSATYEYLDVDGNSYSDTENLGVSCYGMDASVEAVLPTSCDQSVDAAARFSVQLDLDPAVALADVDDFALSTLTVSAVINNGELTEEDLLDNVNQPSAGIPYSFLIDLERYSEGTQTFIIRATTIDDQVITKEFDIPIEKSAPELNLLYPLENQTVCATTFQVEDRVFNAIDISAQILSSQALAYNLNGNTFCQDSFPFDGPIKTLECPENTYEYATRLGSEVIVGMNSVTKNPLLGTYSVQGVIGFAEHGSSGSQSVNVEAFNWSGAKTCSAVNYIVDAEVEGFSISKPSISSPSTPYYFSPNVDGVKGELSFGITTGEYITASFDLYETQLDSLGGFTQGERLGSLQPSTEYSAGTYTVIWDGTIDGSVLSDGRYQLQVTAIDGCGLVALETVNIEIDSQPPSVDLLYPKSSDLFELVIEVAATVEDINFQNFRIEYFDNSNQSILLEEGDNQVTLEQVEAGLRIARWNTFGAEGDYTLRVIARDLAGNITEVEELITIDWPTSLISDHILVNGYLSPDGNGSLDESVVRTSFIEPVIASFRVLNSADTVVRELVVDQSYEPSTVSIVWDGLDAEGFTVADGEYRIEVIAKAQVSELFEQSASATLVYDLTNPDIQIDQLVDLVIELNGETSITGILTDSFMDIAEIVLLADPNGDVNETLSTSSQGLEGLLLDIAQERFEREGFYSVSLKAQDLAGNTTTLTADMLVDMTPPEVFIQQSMDGQFFSAADENIDINGEIVEEYLKNYIVSTLLDDGGSIPSMLFESSELPKGDSLATWDISNQEDGVYQIQVRAIDLAGQLTENSTTVIIDNVIPEIVISEPVVNSFVTGPKSIWGTVSDDYQLQQYEVAITLGQDTNSEDYKILKIGFDPVFDDELVKLQSFTEDGYYTIRFKAIDRADNEFIYFHTVVVDTTPPDTPVIINDVVDKSSPAVWLEWSAVSASDLLGYLVYRNGELLTPDPISELSYIDTDVSEGESRYVLVAIDLAGLESDQAVKDVTVDLTAPDVRISAPVESARVNGLVDIFGTAYSDNDFLSYSLKIGTDTNNLQTLVESTLALRSELLGQWNTLGMLENTPYILRLEAEDIDGNSAAFDVAVSVDNTAPTAAINLQAALVGEDVSISWEHLGSEADLLGYLLYRNNSLVNVSGPVIGDVRPYALIDKAYTDVAVVDGEHVYSVFAIDETGNISLSSNEAELTVNLGLPHVEIVNFNDGDNFENSLYLLGESDDIDLSSVEFLYRSVGDLSWTSIGTDSTAPFEVRWDTNTLAYGDYEITALATDIFGGIDNTPSTYSAFKADLTPPEIIDNLRLVTRAGEISVNWDANTFDSDLSGYNLYWTDPEAFNGSFVLLTENIAESFYVANVDQDGDIAFAVTVVDNSGNESAQVVAETTVFSIELDSVYNPTIERIQNLSGSSSIPGLIRIRVVDSSGEQNYSVDSDVEGDFVYEGANFAPGIATITVDVVHPIYDSTSRTSSQVIKIATLPEQVSGLSGTYNQSLNQIDLNWAANSDEVIGYNIYRDGESLIDTIIAPLIGFYATADERDADNVGANNNRYWFTRDVGDQIGIVFDDTYLIRSIDINWLSNTRSANAIDVYARSPYDDSLVKIESFVDLPETTDTTLVFSNPYRTEELLFEMRGFHSNSAFMDSIAVSVATYIADTSFFDVPSDGYHEYQVSAVSIDGYEGALSDTQEVGFGDIAPPDAVTLNGSLLNSVIDLSWTTATATDFAQYWLYRNGNVILTTTDESFIDGPLLNGTYQYAVVATDNNGNISNLSNIVELTIAEAILPSPVNLTANTTTQYQVDLAWQAAPSSVPVSYNLYRGNGTENFELIKNLSDAFYIDTAVLQGGAYTYFVSAVDVIGNESPGSEEASVTLIDETTWTPGISVPVIPGVSYFTEALTVDLSGYSELMSDVYLIKDGEIIGTPIQSSAQTKTVQRDGYIIGSVESPTGELLLLVEEEENGIYENTFYLTDNGDFLPFELPGVDLNQIYYNFWWVRDGVLFSLGSDLYIFDPESMEVNLLMSMPAYIGTFDIEFYGYLEPTNVIYLYDYESDLGYGIDLDTGETTDVDYFSTTLDGQYRYTGNFVNGQAVIQLTNETSGDQFTYSLETPDCCSFENLILAPQGFSSDNQRVVFGYQKNNDNYTIALYDELSGKTTTLVEDLEEYPGSPVWVFGETGIVYDNNGLTTFINIQTGQQSILNESQGYTYFSWPATSGNSGFLLGKTDGFVLIDNSGRFELPDIYLEEGDNIFSVISVDGSDNMSDISEAILITRAEEAAADLSVVQELDLEISQVGQTLNLEIQIDNDGAIDAGISTFSATVLAPNGEQISLVNQTITALTSGGFYADTFAFIPTESGEYIVVTEIDINNEVDESNESNNVILSTFTIVEESRVYGELSLIESSDGGFNYGSDELVSGQLSLVNAGSVYSGTVELVIEDAAGYEAELLETLYIEDLLAGDSQEIISSWDHSQYFPGDYVFVARIFDEEGILIDSINQLFFVAESINLNAAISLNKASYYGNEELLYTVTLENLGGNSMFAGGVMSIDVHDSNDVSLFAESIDIGQILPSEIIDVSRVWDVGVTPVGTYSISMNLFGINGSLQTTARSAFNVLVGEPLIDGSLTLSNSRPAQGAQLDLLSTVANLGNAELENIGVTINVIQMDSGSIVISDQQEINSTEAGGSVELTTNIVTSALALGDYRVLLVSEVEQSGTTYSFDIAQAFFEVRDSTAPVVTILKPEQGAIINSQDMNAELTVIDQASLILSVQGKINETGSWSDLNAKASDSSIYFRDLDSLADGSYSFYAVATDAEGNTANEVRREFSVDNTLPVVIFSNIQNGQYYTGTVIPEFSVTDTNLIEVAAYLNDEIFVSGETVIGDGEYLLQIDALDAAGNAVTEIVLFGIDSVGAVIEIFGVDEGGSYNMALTPEVEIVESNISSATMTLNGIEYISGTEISAEGSYQLIVEVVDAAGNITVKEVAFEIDLTSPDIPALTNYSDGDSVTEPYINFIGQTETGAAVTLDYAGQSYVAIANSDGVFTMNGIEVVSDENTFSFYATDQAGNISEGGVYVLSFSTSEITVSTDLISNRVLLWLPPKHEDYHPVCSPWNHWGHRSGHDHHYSTDSEALLELLIEVFGEQDVTYTVVRDQDEFLNALRSQQYNSLILSQLDNPIGYRMSFNGNSLLEIRAHVASGTGLLVLTNENNQFGLWSDMLGTKVDRPLVNADQLKLFDSPATEAGLWQLESAEVMEMNLTGGISVGNVEYQCHSYRSRWSRYTNARCEDSAMVINRYYDGDVATLAFNPTDVPDLNDAKAIVSNALRFIRPDQLVEIPNGLREINTLVSDLSNPIELNFEQSLDEGLVFELATEGTILSPLQANWNITLESTSEINFNSVIAVPDEVGLFGITSEAWSGTVSLTSAVTEIDVNQTTIDLESAIRDLVSARIESAGSYYQKRSYQSVQFILEVAAARDKGSSWQMSKAISELAIVIYKLNRLEDGEILVETSKLLRSYERFWYEITMNL